MSIFSKRKRKDGIGMSEYSSTYAKLSKEKEELMRKKELREMEKENRRLKHPRQEGIRKGSKRAGGRLLAFTGGLAREATRSAAKTTLTMRRRKIKGPGVRARGSPSFTAPSGTDISLSGAIASEDWDGGKNVMNTDFFGSEYKEQKDFFGTRDMEETNLIGNKNKKNQDLI